jgi:Zn-dependent oligopeptidase
MARPTTRKWSQEVTEHSDALDLEQGVFKLKDPKRIAASLKDSAEHSERRKSDPYRSAMSMLTFYINRAGAQLQPGDKQRLEKAKDELRSLYHRPASGRPTARGRKVEKPGNGSPAGPSGQRDGAKHDGKHANK